ncbi:hypothetical protein HPP92_024593 [Vanilla planifolia]|uniref:Uncharacterized protein n=1 Tax=Vanilla planifolia TaxID=51239 RepID=A0A835UD46_VANPL|nr:hypothetical protein HPP92_024593 [Vanilla planifolia]
MDDEGLTKELLQNRIVQLEHGCLREKQNLEEELSEAYKIKMQLSDLHNAEVLKNKEVEGQLKFFQGCIASALSERDYSIMEETCVKAISSLGEYALMNDIILTHGRVEELELAYHYEKEQNASLVKELNELKEKIEIFNKPHGQFWPVARPRAYSQSGLTLIRSKKDNANPYVPVNFSVREWGTSVADLLPYLSQPLAQCSRVFPLSILRIDYQLNLLARLNNFQVEEAQRLSSNMEFLLPYLAWSILAPNC